jgi:hypothetical protein
MKGCDVRANLSSGYITTQRISMSMVIDDLFQIEEPKMTSIITFKRRKSSNPHFLQKQ